ncbi:MAG TPA: SDR family oxidoreductase [Alphaproteobacteria bacterium]
MADSDYRTALVTGASSGIGEAVVRALCARGLGVTALARRAQRLEQLAQATGCEAVVVDVRDRDALYAALDDREVDILVNNAGIGRGMTGLAETDPDDIDAAIDTNVGAVLHAVRALVPGMIARGRGHIVNIGSIAGMYPIHSALYGGSKGAVRLLSQNLRLELLGTGVRVTEICPGRVMTEFFEQAYGDAEVVERITSGFDLLQPADIAEAIVYALEAPWHVNVATIELLPTEQAPGGVQSRPIERS